MVQANFRTGEIDGPGQTTKTGLGIRRKVAVSWRHYRWAWSDGVRPLTYWIAWGCLLVSTWNALGAENGGEAGLDRSDSSTFPTHLVELTWLLLIPVGLILAGLLWLALVRHEARRQSRETSRRTAELEAWYQDLFENAHDVLLSLDPHGRLLTLNRAGRELLGVSQDTDALPSLVTMAPAREREQFERMLQQLRSGSETSHGEMELETPTNQRVVLRLNLRRQALPGRSVEIRGVAWDVTAQHEAQEAWHESQQRLQHSLEERIRIGRDLHDGIIQSIYAVGLALGESRRLVTEDTQTASQRIGESVQALNGIIREVRAFIEGLEPAALKGSEFRTALESVAKDLEAPSRLEWALEIEPKAADRLSAQEANNLLPIAREALSNALRHAEAHHVTARLLETPEGVVFKIADDGCGFTLDPAHSPGLGLRNMRARAEDLGGHFDVHTSPHHGTTITITLPQHGSPADISAD